jgi:phosphoglycerate dehydrogenase-like enzyme
VTPATEGLIDAAALAAMKPTAYLLNVARGRLVDEAALVNALAAGRLAGAGLDAVAVEPLPDDSPLWRLPNVIITPHTSAITDRLGDHFVDFWCDNLRCFAEGEPLRGLVDKHAGY